METTITTITMLDPCLKLKTLRMTLATHWLGKASSTIRNPNISLPSLLPSSFESSQVAFATSYLQGITFDHYMALLWFDPNSPVLSNWLIFTQEFSSKFGVFDTVVEAEENLFNLQMRNNEQFMTSIMQFEWKAYKPGWYYNAL
ncbi:hypothetical protein J132_07121 [Termitomyces sp. J132]|nr:hypothetical protein J132_07121 [Termitomyces sp. J132]